MPDLPPACQTAQLGAQLLVAGPGEGGRVANTVGGGTEHWGSVMVLEYRVPESNIMSPVLKI